VDFSAKKINNSNSNLTTYIYLIQIHIHEVVSKAITCPSNILQVNLLAT